MEILQDCLVEYSIVNLGLSNHKISSSLLILQLSPYIENPQCRTFTTQTKLVLTLAQSVPSAKRCKE